MSGVAHGHLSALWHDQPTMGPVSIVLRAPFAALGQLGSDDVVLQYRLGAFACLLACGLLILWLAHRANRGGVHPLICAVFALGLMFNPLMFRTLALGHPEEPLGGLIICLAIVAAADRRVLLAGISLGVAMATKQWALLALGPVLLAASPSVRRPLVVGAVVTAAVLFAPVVLGDPGQFRRAQKEAASPHANATPTNVWWPIDEVAPDARLDPGTERRRPPAIVRKLSHWLVLALAFGAAAAIMLRVREPALAVALLLAALIFLLRCVLDPYTFSYHHWPFLAALGAYEVVARRRFPFLAVIATTCLWYISYHISLRHQADPLLRAYLGWSLPMTALLAYLTVREVRNVRPARPC